MGYHDYQGLGEKDGNKEELRHKGWSDHAAAGLRKIGIKPAPYFRWPAFTNGLRISLPMITARMVMTISLGMKATKE